MQREFTPRPLDVRALAQATASLDGTDPISLFPRLQEESTARDGAAEPLVSWRAQGSMVAKTGGADQVWLHVDATATIPMICQRCMEPVDVDIQVGRDFRFVADEQTAEAEDDEAEEDLLVLSRDFDLLALVEDELIMEVPLVPKHDVCPVPVKLEVADEGAKDSKPPNPFAALGQLRGNKSS